MRHPLDLWRGHHSYPREWSQLAKTVEHLFDDFGWSPGRGLTKDFAFSPSCEVTEDKAHYYLKFDLPGMTKEGVRIEIHDNQLTVTGERKEEKKEDGKRYHVSEMAYGSFMRTFSLPPNIDPEKVEARFENGVLTVAVGKTEEAKSRQVNIKS